MFSYFHNGKLLIVSDSSKGERITLGKVGGNGAEDKLIQ